MSGVSVLRSVESEFAESVHIACLGGNSCGVAMEDGIDSRDFACLYTRSVFGSRCFVTCSISEDRCISVILFLDLVYPKRLLDV